MKYLKRIIFVIAVIYIFTCISISFSYDTLINNMGDNIIYQVFEGEKYIVCYNEDTVDFVKIKDIHLDLFSFAKIPMVDVKISYNLKNPKGTIQEIDNQEYTLLDKNGFLANGIVVKGTKYKIPNGTIISENIYFGVSKIEMKDDIGIANINKINSERLGESYYIFMYEGKEDIELSNYFHSDL